MVKKLSQTEIEREIGRIPVYDFCTAKTYEKSFRPFVRTNSVFLTRAVRKNVRQMSDRQSPSHHIPTSSYVGLLLILISHVSAVHFAYKSVRRRVDLSLQLLLTSPQSMLSEILLHLYTYYIIEQTAIAFFYSETMILLFSYQIQHIFYHLSIVLLLHMYDIRIYGMFSTFQYLMMLIIYFIMVCAGSGVLIDGFHAFFIAYVVVCIIRRICIQYPLF